MHESYALRAARGTEDEFPRLIGEGFQFYADQFAAIIRSAPPEDYPMIVVAMQQCAAVLRTLVPRPRMLIMDEIGREMVFPEIISFRIPGSRGKEGAADV